jgi:hypothetical protein
MAFLAAVDDGRGKTKTNHRDTEKIKTEGNPGFETNLSLFCLLCASVSLWLVFFFFFRTRPV